MRYHVIYDGNCNLCTNLVQLLESFDQGRNFVYTPMQDEQVLQSVQVNSCDCEKGMILIDTQNNQRWQGSDAAEEIAQILPYGAWFVNIYQGLPLAKGMGDRLYAMIRDNRYQLFGKRLETYRSQHGVK
ncbi:DUF393 domain-containing protein [Cyanobacterium stanieri LEGE 03274]|uniref:DUF393 domain-containing protein n=1 Tax=Cyanobacterium stanieri LEGE 03274 TaxID=1828756 RepID=A0ABR9V3R3_9CHRO|nr:DCC1-like thiol-disulfide oxidoreductase family protein [Cyanobacterium stanieri]MBE9222189.1 DUF393 domain-containing protein [Cyanobacterium stanieri LEGE 03274]